MKKTLQPKKNRKQLRNAKKKQRKQRNTKEN